MPRKHWTARRIERELVELHREEAHFLTHKELLARGKSTLMHQLGAMGIAYWAARIGKPQKGVVRRRAIDWQAATARAAHVIVEQGYLPGRDKLRQLGEAQLANFILAEAGSREALLAAMGYEPADMPEVLRERRKASPRRWTSERIRQELDELCDGKEWFPTASELHASGNGKLYDAMWRYGGLDYWAAEVGLPRRALSPWTRRRRPNT